MDLPILLINVTVNVFIGLTVFLRNRRSATHVIFALLAFDIVAWSIANYYSVTATQPDIVLFWMRTVMFFAVLQASLFLLLIITYPSTKIPVSPKKLSFLTVLTLAGMGISLSPYLFTGLRTADGGFSPVPGLGMVVFIIVAFGSVGLGIVFLIRKYRHSKGRLRAQLRFILFGLVTMFSLIILFNFVFVLLLQISTYVAFSSLYSLPFTLSVAYAIARHRFLDIRFIIARTVTYMLVILFVAGFFVFSTMMLGRYAFSLTLSRDQLMPLTGIVLVAVFSFQFIRNWFEHFSDRVLFKGSYDPEGTIRDLNKIMAGTLNLEIMATGIIQKLRKDLRIRNGTFILLNKTGPQRFFGEGVDPYSLTESDIGMIMRSNDLILFDDQQEGPLKDFMRTHETGAAIQLKTEGELIGLFMLGIKESGDVYSEKDVRLLEILHSELSVAIQNALAYDEIRTFNIRLQQGIDRATKDLKTVNTQLQELDKLKNEFVSVASHELRTPMTAIRGSLSTILDGYAGELSKEAREFLTAAYNENDRLIRLVNNLLNISRIEAGKLSMNIAQANIESIVSEVVTNLTWAANEKQLLLKYEKEGEIPPVMADPDKVKEVLINIIGNAIKFTHRGGVTVRLKHEDSVVVTSITDTGSGIAKSDQELLFKKYSQIQGDYAKQSGGTGLGLYISKTIIEQLGGRIWLESTIGIGSTFSFSLPVANRV